MLKFRSAVLLVSVSSYGWNNTAAHGLMAASIDALSLMQEHFIFTFLLLLFSGRFARMSVQSQSQQTHLFQFHKYICSWFGAHLWDVIISIIDASKTAL